MWILQCRLDIADWKRLPVKKQKPRLKTGTTCLQDRSLFVSCKVPCKSVGPFACNVLKPCRVVASGARSTDVGGACIFQDAGFAHEPVLSCVCNSVNNPPGQSGPSISLKHCKDGPPSSHFIVVLRPRTAQRAGTGGWTSSRKLLKRSACHFGH